MIRVCSKCLERINKEPWDHWGNNQCSCVRSRVVSYHEEEVDAYAMNLAEIMEVYGQLTKREKTLVKYLTKEAQD